MKTKHLYTAAASLLLLACSQDHALTSSGDTDSRLVAFSVQTQQTASVTRAAGTAPEALQLTGQGRQLWLMPSVTPTVAETAATRGTLLNSVTDLDNFGVSAFKHGTVTTGKTLNEYLSDNHLKPGFFYNLEATKVEGTERFTLAQDYYWPATNEVLSFFAYAPYGDTKVVPSSEDAEGPQTVRFQVNTDVKQQADFITAQASSTAHTDAHSVPSVRLNFAHQLTAVRFVVGKQFLKGYVKSVALKNVYTEGIDTIGGGWKLDDQNKGNFTISYNMDRPVEGTKGEAVTADDETFFMIPHTFGTEDDATIEVVYNDGYTDYTVSAPLAGTTWQAGTTVTYAITSNKLTTLQVASIDFPATPAAASGMPDAAKAWQENDTVGLYVVAKDSTTLKHKNIPVVYSGGKWNVKHDTPDGTIYRLPGEQYYFYYPYSKASNNQPVGYPEQNPTHQSSAEVFFEGVVNSFPVKANQSVLEDFLASDLMIAKATDEGHASTIKATMERQVGIAVISLASKTIPETITYLNNTKTGETGSYTIAASDQFSTNVPKANGNKFYYFTKVGGSTSFNSKTGEKYYWKAALDFSLAKNAAQEQTAQTDIEWDWTFKTTAIYNYDYQGKVYTFTAPIAGNCKLETWGSAGSASGGYTYGTMKNGIAVNKQLFVCCGGAPYNGGGIVYSTGKAGGGATHIATNNNRGELKNYKNNSSEIVICAGGGGGNDGKTSVAGYGGGTKGGDAKGGDYYTSGLITSLATGGTQTGPGKNAVHSNSTIKGTIIHYDLPDFGFGGSGYVREDKDGGGNGGGGWYGGGGCPNIEAGAGGSGHVNTDLVTGATIGDGSTKFKEPDGTSVSGHSGDGYARITVTRQ